MINVVIHLLYATKEPGGLIVVYYFNSMEDLLIIILEYCRKTREDVSYSI